MAMEDEELKKLYFSDGKETREALMDMRKEARKLNSVIPSRGGSDGCINFADPDNAGLAQCIVATKIESAY